MSTQIKNIFLIEPFYKGSHKYWCNKLISMSRHNITLESRNGVFWKWKMVESELIGQLDEGHNFDIILGTNMLNMSAWAGQNRHRLNKTKLVSYFHENQLTYPGSKNNEFFGFNNISSAISSDFNLFNSEFHKNDFLRAIQTLSQKLPDKIDEKFISKIKQTSSVLPIGIECEKLNENKKIIKNEVPLILWNHRHESDKNPELFFSTLFKLKNAGVQFELVVLGSSPKKPLSVFQEAKIRLQDEIIHWGRVESFEEYASWLWRADILPVTSNHDFFGISVLEAAFCENHLLLPMANAYPDHFKIDEFPENYYHDNEEFQRKLTEIIKSKNYKTEASTKVAAEFSWNKIIKMYDDFLMGV